MKSVVDVLTSKTKYLSNEFKKNDFVTILNGVVLLEVTQINLGDVVG